MRTPMRNGRPMRTELKVNGTIHAVEVAPRTTLLDCLRDHLGLTGAHVGCEHGVCGACTVLLDGVAVRSCLTLAVQAADAEVTTVEGLSGRPLNPLQASFHEHHGLQCGFCTAGLLVTATELLSRDETPSDGELMEA